MARPVVLAFALAFMLAQAHARAQETQPVFPAVTAEPAAAPAANAAIGAQGTEAPTPPVTSHVRIVRLSQIQGKARLDRNAGHGFEPAFANIPITSGARLLTTNGTAEVEFEEGSTLRLASGTEVDFAELGRTATGQTVTVAHLVQGTAYVTLARAPVARFALTAIPVSLNVRPGSHIRLGLAEGQAHLAVLEGAVEMQGPAGNTVVAKKQSLDFEPLGSAPYTVAANIKPEPFDSWDKESDKFQRNYSTASFSGGSGAVFGSADLNYYGSFVDMPGCGSLWRPYFASAAWDPYGSGVWAWYPSAGYSWVSPYPWGWMPFHSGSWQNCGGAGWGWSPGASWYGLSNQPSLLRRIASGRGPVEPLPPGKGAPHYVLSGTREMQYSHLTGPDRFTFRSDSAGLGVPRGSFGNLRGCSSSVAHHGAAATEAETGYLGMGEAARTSHGDAEESSHAVAVLGRPGDHASGMRSSVASSSASGSSGSWSSRGAGTTGGSVSSSMGSGHAGSGSAGGASGGSPGGSGGHH